MNEKIQSVLERAKAIVKVDPKVLLKVGLIAIGATLGVVLIGKLSADEELPETEMAEEPVPTEE